MSEQLPSWRDRAAQADRLTANVAHPCRDCGFLPERSMGHPDRTSDSAIICSRCQRPVCDFCFEDYHAGGDCLDAPREEQPAT